MGAGCAFHICVGCDSFAANVSRSRYLVIAIGKAQKTVLLATRIDE